MSSLVGFCQRFVGWGLGLPSQCPRSAATPKQLGRLKPLRFEIRHQRQSQTLGVNSQDKLTRRVFYVRGATYRYQS